MTRFLTRGLLALTVAFPTLALAAEPARPVAAEIAVEKSAPETRREPVWAMPHKKAEHRRRFSRDLDPRFRELLSVPVIGR